MRTSLTSIIGGERFPPVANRRPGNIVDILRRTSSELSFFSTGRDALYALLRHRGTKTIHVPDLICPSVVLACESAGAKVIEYAVSSTLGSDCVKLEKSVKDNDAVFVMHYFGQQNPILNYLRSKKNVIKISDITHLYYNDVILAQVTRESDFCVGSLRKFWAVPDGGIVMARTSRVPAATKPFLRDFVAMRAAGLWSRGYAAKSRFSNDENFDLLTKAERLLDRSVPNDRACSFLSLKILETVSVQKIAPIIQKNFNMLGVHIDQTVCRLASGPVFSPYFVCRFASTSQRDRVRKALRKIGCFPPIHWVRSNSSNSLADLMLSIPCDERYTVSNMRKIAATINEAL